MAKEKELSLSAEEYGSLLQEIDVVQAIYSENDRIGLEVQEYLTQRGIFAVNVLGGAGAGKTTSLINIAQGWDRQVYVIEGDIESEIDTLKLQNLGIEAIQINTKGACHLDAPVIKKNMAKIKFSRPGFLFIENIGNLVCPAEFHIGEHIRMLICSVAEGSDKPYKYPLVFEKADIILLTKRDLKPYVDFDEVFFYQGIRALNKKAPVIEVNAKTGAGFAEVRNWLERVSGA